MTPNPKRDWLIGVISTAPISNYQQARYKAEAMLDVVAEVEAEVEAHNQAEQDPPE